MDRKPGVEGRAKADDKFAFFERGILSEVELIHWYIIIFWFSSRIILINKIEYMLNTQTLQYDIGPWDENPPMQTFNLKYI